MSPNQENTNENHDKKKKIITPDDYNQEIETMVNLIDEETASRKTMNRTPSLQKIIEKIPNNVNITKINPRKCKSSMQS